MEEQVSDRVLIRNRRQRISQREEADFSSTWMTARRIDTASNDTTSTTSASDKSSSHSSDDGDESYELSDSNTDYVTGGLAGVDKNNNNEPEEGGRRSGEHDDYDDGCRNGGLSRCRPPVGSAQRRQRNQSKLAPRSVNDDNREAAVKGSGSRWISRRRRLNRRRRSNTVAAATAAATVAGDNSDNDHDGDIDRADDNYEEDDGDASCEGNDLNTSLGDDSDSATAEHVMVSNLNRWRQDKPVFVRPRMPIRNKQQEVIREGQQSQEETSYASKAKTTNTTISSNALDGINNKIRRTFSFNKQKQQQHQHNLIFGRLDNRSSRYNFAQCSESGSIFGRPIAFLKNHLFSRTLRQSNADDNFNRDKQPQVWLTNWQSNTRNPEQTTTTTDIHLHDRQTAAEPAKQSSDMPSSSSTGKYQAIHGYDDFRKARRKSSTATKSRSLRESQRLYDPGNYSKLNHHRNGGASKSCPFQEVKRFLFLLVIICACCFVLWKLYQVLLVDQNYLGAVETPSLLGEYKHYAVSTDAKPCAKVGSALLAKGGSAVDAAIGTLLCMGVVIPNSLGLGGGCFMTIYDRKNKKAVVVDGRETAPDYVTKNMFVNDPLKASRGPLSIGIPGELSAYWKAHQLYGKLNWSELFEDTIEMAENGVPTVEHLATSLRSENHAKYISPPLAKIFTNKETGQYYKEGESFVQKELANTLRRIRDNGVKELYGGLTGQLFIKDLTEQGGKITMENLMKYEAIVKESLVFNLDKDLTLHTQPLPASGIALSIILRIMKELGYYKNIDPRTSFEGSSLYYHRLAEAFKHAYAQRAGLEDDPDDPIRLKNLMAKLLSESYIKEAVSKITNHTHSDISSYGAKEFFTEDHGTAHVSVLDSEGNAAAVSSSVNLYFGSGLVSPSTGITYNDIMDDFGSPNVTNKFGVRPSKFNQIKPGRRPISSMAPSVFTDSEGNVKLVIGGSGGAKITTGIATVSLRNCFIGEDIKTAIDGPRIHHQFLPNAIWYELNFPKEILHSLSQRGHSLRPVLDRSSIMMGIASEQRDNGTTRYITANSDYRKGGSTDGV